MILNDTAENAVTQRNASIPKNWLSSKLHINMQFLLHREHRSCPLQRPLITQCHNLLYEDRVEKETNIPYTMQHRPRTCNVTFKSVRVTIIVVEKHLRITYSECVSVALVIQHAKCMRRIILSPVACPALPNFSTLSHKR